VDAIDMMGHNAVRARSAAMFASEMAARLRLRRPGTEAAEAAGRRAARLWDDWAAAEAVLVGSGPCPGCGGSAGGVLSSTRCRCAEPAADGLRGPWVRCPRCGEARAAEVAECGCCRRLADGGGDRFDEAVFGRDRRAPAPASAGNGGES
jgi:hypothetical protein